MSQFEAAISPARILVNSDASSKKRVLEQMSELCAAPEEIELFYQFLINREKLGSTALGDGVALPHCRIPTLKNPIAGFITLNKGVDFNAPDNQPVYLVFGLFVPEEADQTHLDLLAHIASIFSKPHLREQIKQAQTPEEIYNILVAS